MRVHDLLPAGVPLTFVRARHKIAHFLSEAPILFFAVVIGVALIFRFGIGAIRSSTDDSDALTATVTTAHDDSRTPRTPRAPTTVTATQGVATVEETPTATATPATEKPPSGGLPRRKPRAHGKR